MQYDGDECNGVVVDARLWRLARALCSQDLQYQLRLNLDLSFSINFSP